MAIKLHRCSGTWVKVNAHPCWRAQKALDEAGVEYELVLHSSLRFRRPEVEEMTGQRKLPIIEFEDGTLLTESTVIAERARAGTLVPEEKQATPEPPAAPEPPPTSVPEPPSAPSADVPPAAAPQPPPEPPEPPEREG